MYWLLAEPGGQRLSCQRLPKIFGSVGEKQRTGYLLLHLPQAATVLCHERYCPRLSLEQGHRPLGPDPPLTVQPLMWPA